MKASVKAIPGRESYSGRTTSLLYEKLTPDDPLPARVVAGMSPDHPRRVARWLGEVFGGPAADGEVCSGDRGFQRWMQSGVSR
jgi:hypothetical protein